MKKVIQTAIVGFGLSGRVFHAPFLLTDSRFKTVRIVTRRKEEAVSLFPDAAIADQLEDILQDKAIDLVVLCTPNTLHYPMAKECLRAGKHVVVEKPFTVTSKEADELITLAESLQLRLFVYHNRRWDGDFLTLRKIVSAGILGEVREFESHFDRYRPDVKTGSWREVNEPGSGVLYDLGSHLIDQALQLFGTPETLEATIESQRKGSAVDDYFRISLYYQNVTAVLTAGMMVKQPDLKYVMHGHLGSYVKYGIDPQEEALKNGLLPGGKNWGVENPNRWGMITIDYDCLDISGTIETENGCYREFYNNVHEVLIHNADMAVKPSEARNVIRIIELARESNAKSGKVRVDF